ncbi:MAG: hypothetical protein LBM38_00165 [Clostridiales bacterium]|jgi:hypothetical protein|nr:hypothetical protein [Clostridiales bacterium]
MLDFKLRKKIKDANLSVDKLDSGVYKVYDKHNVSLCTVDGKGFLCKDDGTRIAYDDSDNGKKLDPAYKKLAKNLVEATPHEGNECSDVAIKYAQKTSTLGDYLDKMATIKKTSEYLPAETLASSKNFDAIIQAYGGFNTFSETIDEDIPKAGFKDFFNKKDYQTKRDGAKSNFKYNTNKAWEDAIKATVPADPIDDPAAIDDPVEDFEIKTLGDLFQAPAEKGGFGLTEAGSGYLLGKLQTELGMKRIDLDDVLSNSLHPGDIADLFNKKLKFELSEKHFAERNDFWKAVHDNELAKTAGLDYNAEKGETVEYTTRGADGSKSKGDKFVVTDKRLKGFMQGQGFEAEYKVFANDKALDDKDKIVENRTTYKATFYTRSGQEREVELTLKLMKAAEFEYFTKAQDYEGLGVRSALANIASRSEHGVDADTIAAIQESLEPSKADFEQMSAGLKLQRVYDANGFVKLAYGEKAPDSALDASGIVKYDYAKDNLKTVSTLDKAQLDDVGLSLDISASIKHNFVTYTENVIDANGKTTFGDKFNADEAVKIINNHAAHTKNVYEGIKNTPPAPII